MINAKNISDLSGIGKLTIEAVSGITDIVEDLHQTILSMNGLLGSPDNHYTTGITGIVYKNIRTVTGLVGNGIDITLNKLIDILGNNDSQSSIPVSGYEAVVSALNGVVGDHLAASKNPLAITMQLRRNGIPLSMNDNQNLSDDNEFKTALLKSNGKIALMVHGLCMNDLEWNRQGHDHGAALARDLGYLPIYLHYNTGLHISENGKSFSELMEKFINQLPKINTDKPIEIVIIAHSMGGLVSQSSCHYGKLADHRWLNHLTKLICLGTPHHGSPLEQAGNWIDILLKINPYSAPFSRLGNIRSAGVTDLRYGNLLDEDWKGESRFDCQPSASRTPAALPDNVKCYAIAAAVNKEQDTAGDNFIGDGLVPVNSALGYHENCAFNLKYPKDNQWIGRNMNHMELLNREDVYKVIKKWVGC
ncbi:MAG: hypothetical protein HQK63_16180 [Desulfamplus sp.]|nr:hypothetical protein [Desulfamplus sp.]